MADINYCSQFSEEPVGTIGKIHGGLLNNGCPESAKSLWGYKRGWNVGGVLERVREFIKEAEWWEKRGNEFEGSA
jgi:hypothetical protein